MPTTENAGQLSKWLPGIFSWVFLAFPLTAYTGFLGLHNTIWKFGPPLPSGADTALSLFGVLACLFWFSYLGTLVFGRFATGVMQIRALLVVLWVVAIAAEWLLYSAFTPT